MMREFARKLVYRFSTNNLDRWAISLNNYQELKKVFGWKENPILERPDIHDFQYVEDVNERRIRDAESLATVMRNAKPRIALEIGTASGMATVLMSINAPESKIYTVNIPPEEILSGEGGKLTTAAFERDKIGIAYKSRNLENITQIFANTATWKPAVGNIDVVFIDGCHDTKFVYNDTRKILDHMNPGGYILWHDFNPGFVKRHDWIKSVCRGIEKLYRHSVLRGNMFYIRDSWVGIYRVPE